MTMFHQQYWATRPPTSLFEQTMYEVDQLFYATFPAARHAACTSTIDPEQNPYDPNGSTHFPTFYDDVQSQAAYEIHHHEEVPDISSISLQASDSSPSPQVSYPHLGYSRIQRSSYPFHYQDQPSYYRPPSVEDGAAVYIPSEQSQYSSSQNPSPITQSSPGSVSVREPTPFLASQLSNTSTSANNNKPDPQKTISDGRSPESPRHDFRQLNRHMRPPTLKFTNNCQLAVMRLDRFSEHNHSSKSSSSCSASSTKPLHVPSCQITPTPTEFLLSSPKSPSIGLSSIPSKNLPERKPPLACLFCRGRKIACGPPLPGSIKKTCNQCRKRSLQCHYPSESRRGMRKKKPLTTT